MKMIMHLIVLTYFIITQVLKLITFKFSAKIERGNIPSKLYNFKELFVIKIAKINDSSVFNGFRDFDKVTFLSTGVYIEHLDFTYLSLKKIRNAFPDNQIIFSTDSRLKNKDIRLIEELGVTLLINKRVPKDNREYVGNLNSQISNVLIGLDKVRNKSNYIVRLRSDLTFMNHNFLRNLFIYNSIYDKNNSRMIKISMNSYLHRQFSTSDMFMFGKYKELKKYWSLSKLEVEVSIKNLEMNNILAFPESILDTNYFYKTFGYFPNEYSDYIKLLSMKYIIIDDSNVDILWYKVNPLQPFSTDLNQISHADWLSIKESLD
jgi:hypothetical protein